MSQKPKSRPEILFIDANVLITASHDQASVSAELLRRCARGIFQGHTSDIAIEECRFELRNHTESLIRFESSLQFLRVTKVADDDLTSVAPIADPKDRHVLRGAELSKADYIVTLDWKHFLSSSARARLKDYPIPCTFPGRLVNSFRDKRLPAMTIETWRGAVSMGVDPNWTSDTVARANRPFVILDLSPVFSIWYDVVRRAMKMKAEVYRRPRSVEIPRTIQPDDGFLVIVTWDVNKGFRLMIDDVLREIRGRWDLLPLKGRLWLGCDRDGANQINAAICFDGWPRPLSEKEMRRIYQGGYVSLPETPVSV